MPKGYKGREKSERLHMLVSPSELKDIDNWRFDNRVGTRAEAVRRLVQIGLIFDEHAYQIAKDFTSLYDEYGAKALAAAESLTRDDNDRDAGINEYVAKNFTLSIQTIEKLGALLSLLNLVMAPVHAMKADAPFEAAQYGFLAAKADSMAKLLKRKIAMYEFKKEHGMLPDDEGEGAGE